MLRTDFKPDREEILSHLQGLNHRIQETRRFTARGTVEQVTGMVIESRGPSASLGDLCHIHSPRAKKEFKAEVVGFRGHTTLLMPYSDTEGLHPGSEVVATDRPVRVPVGNA